MWRWKAIGAATVGLTLIIGAVAYAAIPASSGTISACYAKSNGVLRVIDAEAGESCEANKELALSWNQQGQPGPPGPASIQTREVVMQSEGGGSENGFEVKVATAQCAEGEFVTGGGFVLFGPASIASQVTVTESKPTKPVLGVPPDAPPTFWQVRAIAPIGTVSWGFEARAVCATPTSAPPPLP